MEDLFAVLIKLCDLNVMRPTSRHVLYLALGLRNTIVLAKDFIRLQGKRADIGRDVAFRPSYI